MKIIEVTASLGRAIQFVSFQPHNFHASCKVELEEGEDSNDAYRKAFQACEVSMKEEIDKFKELYGTKKKQPDTVVKEDGVYVVWKNGEKKLYTRKTTYKGMPQEKLKEFYTDYVKDSVECKPENTTKDLTI